MNNEYFYRNILDNLYEGIYFVDIDRKITYWNKGAERITGFSSSDVIGHFCFNNILNHVNDDGKQLCLSGCPLHKTIKDGTTRESAIYLHHKDGHRVSVTVKTIAIYDGDKIVGAVEAFTDDLEKHGIIKDNEELRALAMRDQLTGLSNRRYIDAYLKSKINEYETLGIPFGIAFMDIDKFKSFNDIYGHDIGDEVLIMVAKTCNSIIRSTDLVGRWGGEEFLAVFTGVNEEKLFMLTEKTRMLVEKSSLRKDKGSLKVTISIGATVIKEGDTIEQAVKRADDLLYKSKVG